MKEQICVQNLLRAKYVEFQHKNPRYSLRAYAKRVGIHVGALSSILNGKRNVSRKIAERIVQKLLLDPQQKSEILNLFLEKKSSKTSSIRDIEPRYIELTSSQFKIASEWEHFALLSLMKCKDFESSFSWIAKRLGITETKAKQVVSRLLQAGLIETESEGRLIRSKKSFRTSDEIANISIKKHHEQSLDLAKHSLFRDSVRDRDFSSITMAVNVNKIEKAKELIRKFEDDISDLLESEQSSEVYRLSVQLFPLSVLTTRGEKK